MSDPNSSKKHIFVSCGNKRENISEEMQYNKKQAGYTFQIGRNDIIFSHTLDHIKVKQNQCHCIQKAQLQCHVIDISCTVPDLWFVVFPYDFDTDRRSAVHPCVSTRKQP